MCWGRGRGGGFVGCRFVGRSVEVCYIRDGGGQEGVRRVWVKMLFNVVSNYNALARRSRRKKLQSF